MFITTREMLLANFAATNDMTKQNRVNEVVRNSPIEFDLHLEGTTLGKDGKTNKFSAWLPLAAIGATDWSSYGPLTDFGNLDAGWSAIRDSCPETIYNMLLGKVLSVALMNRPKHPLLDHVGKGISKHGEWSYKARTIARTTDPDKMPQGWYLGRHCTQQVPGFYAKEDINLAAYDLNSLLWRIDETA
jgi:hypothetical protein